MTKQMTIKHNKFFVVM